VLEVYRGKQEGTKWVTEMGSGLGVAGGGVVGGLKQLKTEALAGLDTRPGPWGRWIMAFEVMYGLTMPAWAG